MLYVLAFTTCLSSGYCVQRQHVFDESITTPQQCLSVAQPVLAKWITDREHERWKVEAFRCGKPPKGGQTI